MRRVSLPMIVLVPALVCGAVFPLTAGSSLATGSSTTGPPLAAADPAPAERAIDQGDQAGAESDLDVLFVGAHPDDEASSLSTFGQWRQKHDVSTGVVTITRGEGGGNAVGPEEGPELGLLREGEERRAVGKAGITDVHNLDEADLYYTVSAGLTERAWGHDDVLSKLVRVVRQTRPEIVVTMNPAPTGDNHGNHQYATRLALEAYRLAGDTSAFPKQITDEGLAAWSVRRVLGSSDGPARGRLGEACERVDTPDSAPGRWYGVWAGRRNANGETWAQREVAAQREYVSQGWANTPDAPENPAEIECDYFSELANRAPHADAVGPDAPLSGVLVPETGTLPLGTDLTVRPDDVEVVPGAASRVRATVTAPANRPLPGGSVSIRAPQGWDVRGDGTYPRLQPGASSEVSLELVVPEEQALGRVPVPVRVASGAGGASEELRLDVVGAVHTEQAPLPGLNEFGKWAHENEFPLVSNLVDAVRAIPSGESATVTTRVTNNTPTPRSGTVRMDVPEGFSVEQAEQPFHELPPGETADVAFRVSNTDSSMETGMQGGEHRFKLTTHTGGGVVSRSEGILELVPQTRVPQRQAAPVVDGHAAEGEYPGTPLDLSARWEGEECESPRDCSGSAKLSWHGGHLYTLINITDDTPGTALRPSDCKRHWRTDSVELALDGAGGSENTSSTLKLGILPRTDDPENGNPPCFARDADNNQGPGEDTAPGVRIASHPRPDGYTIEAAIPFDAIPGSIDPKKLGLNLLVYDSDTQDQTGQTRLGWSTWEGVQGVPHRWGNAVLRNRPPEEPNKPPAPNLPLDALSSVDSVAAMRQAHRLGIAPGGAPPAGENATRVTRARGGQGDVRVRLDMNGPGQAHVFALDGEGNPVGDTIVGTGDSGHRWVTVKTGEDEARGVLVGFRDGHGATAVSGRRVE